jgi:hypothetical protein
VTASRIVEALDEGERLPRAVAVKDGRLLRPPEGLVLDGREHGGRLVCVAIDGCCNLKEKTISSQA